MSACQRGPSPTYTENTSDEATDEHSEPDPSGHAQCNGFRAKEDKRSTKYKLDGNNTRSKQRSIPKKQSISVVFNYSKIELTQPMKNLLNRGFIYATLPLKLDLKCWWISKDLKGQ